VELCTEFEYCPHGFYTVFLFQWTSCVFLADKNSLLKIQFYCFKVNHTTVMKLHSQTFFLYLIKRTSYRKMFQITVAGLNEILISPT